MQTITKIGLDIAKSVFQARRGWLTADDVVNTQPLARLRQWLKR